MKAEWGRRGLFLNVYFKVRPLGRKLSAHGFSLPPTPICMLECLTV